MRRGLELSGMALFVRIVEDGSLSAAGRSLGLPKATVSRRLVELELSLGAPLLTRSSRALSLTDAGREFFERVRPIVHAAQSAQEELRRSSSDVSGLLRVTAPVAFGETVVVPGLMKFMDRYPRIRADLHFSDERVNIIAEGYDLAIRVGELVDSELVGRKLADMLVVLVASPSYLACHGSPKHAADLRRHNAVLTDKSSDSWNLDGKQVKVAWRISTGSMSVTRASALSGLGIAQLPEFFVRDDLAAGRLIQVLASCALPKSSVTVLHPRSSIPSAALRALLDAVRDWC